MPLISLIGIIIRGRKGALSSTLITFLRKNIFICLFPLNLGVGPYIIFQCHVFHMDLLGGVVGGVGKNSKIPLGHLRVSHDLPPDCFH